MIYTIPKSEYKKGVKIKHFLKCMNERETRMKWDKSMKDFIILDNTEKNIIIRYYMKSPVILVSERDFIDKNCDFFENNYFFRYSSGVDDDLDEKYKTYENVQRIFNYISIYTIEEDDENFIFKSINQVDYKMNMPPALMNVTLPFGLKDFYKNMKNLINSDEFEL